MKPKPYVHEDAIASIQGELEAWESWGHASALGATSGLSGSALRTVLDTEKEDTVGRLESAEDAVEGLRGELEETRRELIAERVAHEETRREPVKGPERECAKFVHDHLPAAREAARAHGYAIAVHGSLARDVDLVAVPWTAEASDADALVAAIAGALPGVDLRADTKPGSPKPHGRRAWTLVSPAWPATFVDLSVTPRAKAIDAERAARKEAERQRDEAEALALENAKAAGEVAALREALEAACVWLSDLAREHKGAVGLSLMDIVHDIGLAKDRALSRPRGDAMKVWIMSIGYEYEGDDVQSVHVHKDAAIAAAERAVAEDGWSTWSSADHRSEDVIVWSGGVKYVNVCGYEVDTAPAPTSAPEEPPR